MARWQITKVPEELDKAVRGMAWEEGENLRTVVVRLVKEGLGCPAGVQRVSGRHLAGVQQTPKSKNEEVREEEVVPDPRHGVVRELIRELYRKQFKLECTWDGSEGKRLKDLLKANPKWTEGQLKTMVENYFKTEGVTAERPRVWLKTLGAYVAGPLNRYRRVAEKGNGEGKKTSPDQYLSRDEIEAKNAKRYREMVERGEIIEREV